MLEYLVARAIIEDRMREALRHSQAGELRRDEQPTPDATSVRKAPRPSRLWSLVHLRQAHS